MNECLAYVVWICLISTALVSKDPASIYIPRIQEKTDPHPKPYKDTVELREGVLTFLAGELS